MPLTHLVRLPQTLAQSASLRQPLGQLGVPVAQAPLMHLVRLPQTAAGQSASFLQLP